MPTEAELVSPDPRQRAGGRYRGFVERLDPKRGIEGWALDLAAPEGGVTVELHAGLRRVARATTEFERADVAEAAGLARATPVFRFGAEVMRELRSLARVVPDAALRLTVGGTTAELQAAMPMPRLAQMFDPLAATTPPAGADPVQRLLEGDPAGGLAVLRRLAEPLAARPIPSRPQAHAGYVEEVARDTAGLIWFSGWIRGEPGLALPGVLVDAVKHPAGVVYAAYRRSDLPAGAFGIVGAIATDWRPNETGNVALLHLGEGAEAHLRVNATLPTVPMAEWIARFRNLRAELFGPMLPALERLLGAVTSWVPGNAAALGLSVEQGIDRILVLPGFGALVEGWVLSPAHRPQGLMLRVGDRVLQADPASTYWKPRPDLAGTPGAGGRLAEEAGYVAVFRGELAPEDLTRPVMKFVFSDGLATNHALDARSLRLLGHAAAFEEVLALYPDPAAEPFFPALAGAVAAELAPRLREVMPVRVATAPRALVAGIADHRSEVVLAFANLAEALRHRRLPGVVVLAAPGADRALTLTLFRGLEDIGTAPCSLFFLPEPAHAPYALPEVLAATGTERFAFLGPGLHADEAALTAISEALAAPAADQGFGLAVVGAAARRGARDRASAEAFVAATADASPWLEALPPRMGGLASGELELPLSVRAGAGAALRGFQREAGRFAAMVNARLGAGGEQGA